MVVVVVGMRRHLGVDIGMRTMKVKKKLMMNKRMWEEFVMMMENTVKMTPTMILMKLDEGML